MNNLTWQEKLNRLLNCDLKSLYPVARGLKRKLYFYVGPTNSGKTYEAMKELKEAIIGKGSVTTLKSFNQGMSILANSWML
jgi:ATP-dependent RNA helicase SUPV3L1/SUV3